MTGSVVSRTALRKNPVFDFGATSIMLLESWRGVTDAGSGAVSAWADQGTAGASVTQSDSARRPNITNRTYNGYQVMDFDGNNALGNGDCLDTNFPADRVVQAGLIICNFDSTSVDQCPLGCHTSGGSLLRFNGNMVVMKEPSTIVLTDGAPTANTPAMWGYVWNDTGNTAEIWKNNVQVASGSNSQTLTSGPNRRIGANNANAEAFNGWIAVVVDFIGVVPTSTQWGLLFGYYNDFLGIY